MPLKSFHFPISKEFLGFVQMSPSENLLFILLPILFSQNTVITKKKFFLQPILFHNNETGSCSGCWQFTYLIAFDLSDLLTPATRVGLSIWPLLGTQYQMRALRQTRLSLFCNRCLELSAPFSSNRHYVQSLSTWKSISFRNTVHKPFMHFVQVCCGDIGLLLRVFSWFTFKYLLCIFYNHRRSSLSS